MYSVTFATVYCCSSWLVCEIDRKICAVKSLTFDLEMTKYMATCEKIRLLLCSNGAFLVGVSIADWNGATSTVFSAEPCMISHRIRPISATCKYYNNCDMLALQTWQVTRQWLLVRSSCRQFSRALWQSSSNLLLPSWPTGSTLGDTLKVWPLFSYAQSAA